MEKFYKRPKSFDMDVSLKSYKKVDFNDKKPVHNIPPISKKESDLLSDKLNNNPIKSNTPQTHIKDLYNYGGYNESKSNYNNDYHIKFLRNSKFGFNKPSKVNYEPDNIIKNNIFGNPTDEQIRISNMQTEAGVSNPLNDRIISHETGVSLPELREINDYIDNERDKEINKIMDELKNKTNISPKNKKSEDIINKYKQTLKQNANEQIDEIKQKYKNEKATIKPVLLDRKNKELNEVLNKQNEEANKRTEAFNKQNEASNKIKQFYKKGKEKKFKTEINNLNKNVEESKNKREYDKNKQLQEEFNNANKDIREKSNAASKIQKQYKKKQMNNTVNDIIRQIEKDNDVVPNQTNPLHTKKNDETKTDETKTNKEKQKEAYLKKQEEINKYNEIIRNENEKYETFTNLYDEINKYPDGTVFDTNDPIRKKLNKSLQQYGKDNIKSSKKNQHYLNI
jgi:hypothetical protein